MNKDRRVIRATKDPQVQLVPKVNPELALELAVVRKVTQEIRDRKVTPDLKAQWELKVHKAIPDLKVIPVPKDLKAQWARKAQPGNAVFKGLLVHAVSTASKVMLEVKGNKATPGLAGILVRKVK